MINKKKSITTVLEKLAIKFRELGTKPEERGKYSSGYWPSRIREEALKICVKEKGTLLDVGCGEGFFLVNMARAAPKLSLSGIDKREEILKEAKKHLKEANIKNVKIFKGDGRNLPFEKSSFDVVVCLNTIFNLPSKKDVYEIISEMSRVCKVKGKIVLDIRNKLNPLLYLKYRLAKYYDPDCKVPLKTYRLKEIKNILEKVGFKITGKVRVVFALITPIILVEAKRNKKDENV